MYLRKEGFYSLDVATSCTSPCDLWDVQKTCPTLLQELVSLLKFIDLHVKKVNMLALSTVGLFQDQDHQEVSKVTICNLFNYVTFSTTSKVNLTS